MVGGRRTVPISITSAAISLDLKGSELDLGLGSSCVFAQPFVKSYSLRPLCGLDYRNQQKLGRVAQVRGTNKITRLQGK